MTDQAIALSPELIQNSDAVAGQWKLIWRRFRRHRLALAAGVVIFLIYLVALFAEVLARFHRRPTIPATPMRRRSRSSSPATTRPDSFIRSTSRLFDEG